MRMSRLCEYEGQAVWELEALREGMGWLKCSSSYRSKARSGQRAWAGHLSCVAPVFALSSLSWGGRLKMGTTLRS